MKVRLIRGLVVSLICAGGTGCVETTIVRDAPRTGTTFESADGAKLFYEAYIAKNYVRDIKSNVAVYVHLPPLPYWQREVKSDNVLFDDAVNAADTNHDGTISDDEARAYSDKVHPRAPRSAAVALAKAS
jgi:hypothetical protein